MRSFWQPPGFTPACGTGSARRRKHGNGWRVIADENEAPDAKLPVDDTAG